jgi:alkane 1-monooxygenase
VAAREARYARKKQHPFRIGNDVLNAWLMSACCWGALIAWLGIGILPYLPRPGRRRLLAARGRQLHGALRDAAQKVGVGERQRYERVDPTHSWNSNNIATNVLLYHLQRHSDHHANPTRRYQTLRDFEESPVLPTGVRRDDRPRARARPVAPGDGPAGCWRTSRRPEGAREPQPAEAGTGCSRGTPRPVVRGMRRGPGRAGPSEPSGLVAPEVLAARCPGCDYVYDVRSGDEHEGFEPWHGRGPDVPGGHLVLPRLRGPRQGLDFVPLVLADPV